METVTSTNSFMSSDGFISINFISDNTDLGKEIVNFANYLFLDKTIEFETEKARKQLRLLIISLNH